MEIETPFVLTIKKGFANEHLNQIPLFDRISYSKREKCIATRTYQDGAHYLILHDEYLDTINNKKPEWEKIAQVSPEGIEKLKDIIEKDVVEYNMENESVEYSPIITERILWIFYGKKEFNITTRSGSYESLPKFVTSLDETINKNLVVLEE